MNEEVVIDKSLSKKIGSVVKKNFSDQQDFLARIAETNSVNVASGLDEKKPQDNPVELGVARLIRKELKAVGLRSEYVSASKKRPNVVSIVGPTRSRKNLIFNAHMDTPEPTGNFRGDPLTPFVRGKKIYGLGLLRSKAMIAAFLYAGAALKELNLPLSGKLLLQFVVDGMSGAESKLGTKYLLNKGVKAKAAVLGYPGEVVGIGHRGGYRFGLKIKGEEIETSSTKWQQGEKGKNAIMSMVEVANALKDVELPYKPAKAFPGKKPVFTFPTMIEGGVAEDMVPELCEAVGDVRLMPGNSDKQVRLRIEEKVNSVKGMKYKLEDLLYVPAVEIDQKEEIVQVVADEINEVYGEAPRVEGIGEWNSGWMFIQKDIPAIVQLPLKGGEYRGNHDWVDLKSLRELTEAMTRSAISFLGLKKEV